MSWLEEPQENWLEELVKIIEKTTQLYNVHVTYPEYSSGGQSLVIFNSAIYGKILGYVDKFTSTVEGLMPAEAVKSELEGAHVTYTALKQYITAKFDLYPYFGGTHRGHEILTITFDTVENKILSLSDLFEDGYDYPMLLSTLAEKALPQKYPELEFAFSEPAYRKGFSSDADNFAFFALTDDGLSIFFREYQVAPSAAGNLSICIPFGDIPGLAIRIKDTPNL